MGCMFELAGAHVEHVRLPRGVAHAPRGLGGAHAAEGLGRRRRGRRRARAAAARVAAAEAVVVDQARDGRRVLARLELDLVEAHAQRVVHQQPAAQRAALAPERHLDRLGGLHAADDSRQHAEHAANALVKLEYRGNESFDHF